jgi:hypothetical protein
MIVGFSSGSVIFLRIAEIGDAVDARSLVIGRRNGAQAGEEDHHLEAEPGPDRWRQHRRQRLRRRAQEGLLGEAEATTAGR